MYGSRHINTKISKEVDIHSNTKLCEEGDILIL